MKPHSAGAILALLLTFFLLLSACGRSETAAPAIPPADTAAVMEQVRNNLTGVTSMTYEMVTDMDLTMLDQPFPLTADLTGECLVSPMTMTANIHIDADGIRLLDARLFLLQEGDVCALYAGMDTTGSGTLTWTRKTTQNTELLEQFNVRANMDLYLENGNAFAYAGTEELGGVPVDRYDGVISQDVLSRVLASNGLQTVMGKLGIEDPAAVLEGVGDLSLSIWVDPAVYLPVRYEMDLTSLSQHILDGLLVVPPLNGGGSSEAGPDGGSDMTADRVVVTVNAGSYNDAASIQLPLEALTAFDEP